MQNNLVFLHTITHISKPFSYIPATSTQAISISDCAFLLSSTAATHFLISNPMAAPIGGGTALPIYNKTIAILQVTFRKSCRKMFTLKTKSYRLYNKVLLFI
jgi:hypothetical protein